ncbi:DUF4160 domain-containing protein [uncultured Fibrobacter sp.]|uniref:DUF4160 domain-containing protein n=1 Tax=uncultured Fibrobacter sp. TaxID=261512 RepID=UPI002805DF3C|nr:DUF4160 domain-containing protein [uncultured Fibrobacter sp.]
MPKVFDECGFRFFFYMNEHEPVHVHVRKGRFMAKFEISDRAVLVSDNGLPAMELKKAREIANRRKAEILEKWHGVFG